MPLMFVPILFYIVMVDAVFEDWGKSNRRVTIIATDEGTEATAGAPEYASIAA